MPHQIVTREKWITARKKLFQAEKDLTRKSDDLAKRRHVPGSRSEARNEETLQWPRA
jgi:predicted dithiol-disulfide oxidoreductase (DUF899 family)